MMQKCNVQEATHVKIKGGEIEKIVSKWGLDSEGRPAKPSEGGFGVVTESGNRVHMYDADAYYIDEKTAEKSDGAPQGSRRRPDSEWSDGIGRP